jgi:hypothetical protein
LLTWRLVLWKKGLLVTPAQPLNGFSDFGSISFFVHWSRSSKQGHETECRRASLSQITIQYVIGTFLNCGELGKPQQSATV